MPFAILETLALDGGQLRHPRLAPGAHGPRCGAFCLSLGWARRPSALAQLAQAAPPHGLWRCRLQLHANGQVEAQAFACPPAPAHITLQWASAALAQAHSEFVRFETTRRAHYEALAPAADSGIFDSVLFNEAGEITECTRGNIAAQLADGRWVTPPLACGLLPGIGRAVALQQGRVVEAVIRPGGCAPGAGLGFYQQPARLDPAQLSKPHP